MKRRDCITLLAARSPLGRSRRARSRATACIVAGKPANKAQPDSVTAAELVERRAGAKGNANQPARTGLSAGSRVVLRALTASWCIIAPSCLNLRMRNVPHT